MVEVPNESTEWDIDDFLGNCLQYKINGVWKYDTKIDLPVDDLKVVGLLNNVMIEKLDLNPEKKWILIKCKR